jgi:serine/threonine protein kinase
LDGGSTADGLPYLVMEYVDGVPIDRYCDEHELTISARVKLFQQVCAAVEYAHQRSVVHRDLKPTNILVTNEGTVKLLDFGIAKLLHSTGEDTLYLTRSGLHLMTPEYASPEQVRGATVTTGTDVYALGVILYELLTGHRPYRIRTKVLHELARIICEEQPTRPSSVIMQTDAAQERRATPSPTPESVSRLRQTTPVRLKWRLLGSMDSIVLKCLRKEPSRRYASAAELSEDLNRYLSGLSVSASTGRWSHWTGNLIRRAPAWVAMGFFVLALRLHLVPALVIGASIPLVMRLVPPNRWYGVRTPKTFSSLDMWYRVNQVVGWWMIAGALVVICFSLVLWKLHPDWPASKLNYWTNIAMAISIVLISAASLLYVKRL